MNEQQTSLHLRLLDRWKVKFVLVLMWAVTVLLPLVILPSGISGSDRDGWNVNLVYFFLFGSYYQPSRYHEPSGWISGPGYLLVIVMLLLFFIIYAFQVTLYYMKPTTQRWAIISGVLSLLIPGLLGGMAVPVEAGVYVGPLPFQFILGLVVMRLATSGNEEPESGLVKERFSWWEKESE